MVRLILVDANSVAMAGNRRRRFVQLLKFKPKGRGGFCFRTHSQECARGAQPHRSLPPVACRPPEALRLSKASVPRPPQSSASPTYKGRPNFSCATLGRPFRARLV